MKALAIIAAAQAVLKLLEQAEAYTRRVAEGDQEAVNDIERVWNLIDDELDRRRKPKLLKGPDDDDSDEEKRDEP